MKQKLTNNSGFTLLSVILVITIISVLGTSVVGVTLNSVKTSSAEQDDQAVFYIAEAGINVTMAELNEIALEYFELPNINGCSNNLESSSCVEEIKKEASNSYFQNLENKIEEFSLPIEFEEIADNREKPHVSIDVNLIELKDDYTRIYNVQSIGNIGNTKRVLEQDVSIIWPEDLIKNGTNSPGGEIPKRAMYVSGNIDLHGGITIIGDIETTKKSPATIYATGNHTIEGDIFVPEGYDNNAIVTSISGFPKSKVTDYNSDFPTLPDFPTINIKENSQNLNFAKWDSNNPAILQMEEDMDFSNITVNGHLTIKTGDSPKELNVKKLKLGEGYITVTGAGLTINVKEEFSMGGGSTINKDKDINKVNIFYAGSDELQFQGSQKVFGSLYSKDANVTLTAGSGFQGNIFTGGDRVTISGGTGAVSKLILAPFADIVHSGGGSVKGTVIGKSYKFTGGGKLIYDPNISVVEGPISRPGLTEPDDEEVDIELNLLKKLESVKEIN